MINARRIIIGHNDSNQSHIVKDDCPNNIQSYLKAPDGHQAHYVDLWPDKSQENALWPEKENSIFRICTIIPDRWIEHQLDDLIFNGQPLTAK